MEMKFHIEIVEYFTQVDYEEKFYSASHSNFWLIETL